MSTDSLEPEYAELADVVPWSRQPISVTDAQSNNLALGNATDNTDSRKKIIPAQCYSVFDTQTYRGPLVPCEKEKQDENPENHYDNWD